MSDTRVSIDDGERVRAYEEVILDTNSADNPYVIAASIAPVIVIQKAGLRGLTERAGAISGVRWARTRDGQRQAGSRERVVLKSTPKAFRKRYSACMVIPFYIPKSHDPERYAKRFGRTAKYTPPRLRGRELSFPDGKLVSRLIASDDDISEIQRQEMSA